MKKPHLRHMNPYHPRKSGHTKLTLKQELGDLQKKIFSDLGAFLVLNEEGAIEQTAQAKAKGRTDLLKYGPEMKKIAEQIGGKYPQIVGEFLDSIDEIMHSAVGWVDEAKINHCYHVTEILEKELHA